jgi:serine/threonine protein kinase
MSPEQTESQALDARTDLFSLGAVVYEMATGKAPFAGGSTAAIFAALPTRKPPPVSAVREQEAAPAAPRRGQCGCVGGCGFGGDEDGEEGICGFVAGTDACDGFM